MEDVFCYVIDLDIPWCNFFGTIVSVNGDEVSVYDEEVDAVRVVHKKQVLDPETFSKLFSEKG